MSVLDLARRTKAHQRTALDVPARHGTAHASDPEGCSDGRPSPPTHVTARHGAADVELSPKDGASAPREAATRSVESVKGLKGTLKALPVSVLLTLALAPSAPLAAEPPNCPNEAVRAESNINPTTHEPYDMGLPECRAYEVVTPLEKQQHDAITAIDPLPVSVSPSGGAITWTGQGAYAGAENYQVGGPHPTNPYAAQRTASGWITRSAYPPSSLLESSGELLFSSDLSREATCGTATLTGASSGPTIQCAIRKSDGSWLTTPGYTDLPGTNLAIPLAGISGNLADVVFYGEKGVPFLPSDTSGEVCNQAGSFTQRCGGLYEIAGLGTESSQLRLVDVDNSGSMIGPENPAGLGAGVELGLTVAASNYQAISADGSTIYFTAEPAGGYPTVYARIAGEETVTLSDPSPSECTRSESALGGECDHEPSPALFQGASADGLKAFFTTAQQLTNSDTDSEADLYEYNFASPPARRLVQVSGGGLGDLTPGAGAQVQGVVNVSQDGSHLYFVAGGVLTTLPNARGQSAQMDASNLYAYDTETDETKFVATLLKSDSSLWGLATTRTIQTGTGTTSINESARLAQTTPDGRYLVFDTYGKLITAGPEADTDEAQDVYRYDFETGELIRVSHGAGPGGAADFGNDGNMPSFNAVIGPADDLEEGAASPAVNDSNRSINENGETIVFTTAETLEGGTVGGGANTLCDEGNRLAHGAGCQVYEWHDGSVKMISDGQDATAIVYAGMSATGSDIFFQTRTRLVGQDTDELGDIYDARMDGGFPAPTPEPSCSGEDCQGTPSAAPTFRAPGTVSFTDGANDVAPPFKPIAEAVAPGAVKITAHSSKSLSVFAPGAGKLMLSGSGLATLKKTAPKAGTYTLALILTSSERKLLAKHRSVTLKVRVTFTPASGKASSATTKVTIKKAIPKAKSKSKKKG